MQRLAIKIERATNPERQLVQTENEVETFSICKRLIDRRDTKLLLSPISGKRYIHNVELQISIIIEKDSITLVNHVYSYVIPASNSKLYNRVVSIFDVEVERRRNELEQDIRKNIQHSLKSIYQNLVDERI